MLANRLINHWKRRPLRYAALATLLLIVSATALFIWPHTNPSVNPISLTPEEKAWIAEHHGKIRFAPDPNFAPVEFFDSEGNFSGLVADYMHLIEQWTGLHFKILKIDSWPEILHKAKTRQLDMLSCATPTIEREQYFDFTTPITSMPYWSISHKNIKKNLPLEKMRGLRLLTIKGYAINNHLKRSYPDLTVKAVPSVKDGLKMVALQEADILLTTLPFPLKVIENSTLTNLRLLGEIDYKAVWSIATRNDWPTFHRIIQKGLTSISAKERNAIYRKWIHPDLNPSLIGRHLLITAVAVSAVLLCISGLVLFWNRSLKKNVDQRTEAMHLNEQRMEALLSLYEMTDASIKEIINYSFREAIRLTRSEFGYLDFAEKTAEFQSIIMERNGAVHPVGPGESHPSGFPLATMGLWREAICKGQPVISNDYAITNPLSRGLPADTRSVVRYMNVPIMSNVRVVAVAGVGNKSENYDPTDERQLRLLMEGMWRIVQRRRSDAALLQSEERFRRVVESGLTGIAILQSNCVVFRNSVMERMFGARIKIFEGRDLEAIHSDDRRKFNKFCKAMVADGSQSREINFRYFPPEDSQSPAVKWVYCYGTGFTNQGKPATLLSVIDVTHQKELENRLVAQDKMASLGRVAAGIAHEIRNPLSGINLFVEMLADQLANDSAGGASREIIDDIQGASAKIESVIRRVMDFAKPGEPKFMVIDLNTPVRAAIDLSRVSLRKGGIRLETLLAYNLPPVSAEANQIEEVVLNLINNAAEAMKSQTGAKIIRISLQGSQDVVKVIVADTGPGVPSENQLRIFEPFFTTKTNSTGIGLNLCQRIASDHGGILRVENGSLGGAEFVLTLPAYVGRGPQT